MGNGVFVDATGGNWCEGLTTYVADYLSKEEHTLAEARAYRLRTLEKYALLAAGAQDFPLSAFRNRYNPASQAVGYGKAMFVFHMMRRWIGDAAFWAALRDIYAERLFQRTRWGHFMDAFAAHGGLDRDAVRTFHDQWITRRVPCNWPWTAPDCFRGRPDTGGGGTHPESPPLQRPRAGGGDD